MKVYRDIVSFTKLKNAVVTSGTFDGVHIGHQKIIKRLKDIAENTGGETVLITFWPHPRLVLYPNQPFKLLNSIEEKILLLEKYGIDHLIIIPFTQVFSEWSSEKFIQEILVKSIGTKKLVIGYNHRFGKHRSGSFDVLKKDGPIYGFEVEEIPKQEIDHVGISSTKIRKALEAGKVDIAAEYLNRPYCMNSSVIEGDKLGREIGFPTANLEVSFDQKLIPANGIYAVKVKHGHKHYLGMLNIGYRPTIKGTTKRIEVHILNFRKDIYHENLIVYFYKQLRTEIRFPDITALQEQLGRDKNSVISYFKEYTSRI
jgi:riboflavin kinase/FMN adenylyltransferase